MKGIRAIELVLMLLFVGLSGGGQSPIVTPPAEVRDPDYLHEICHFLYLWYWEENDIAILKGNDRLEIWLEVREMDLDPGDKSRFVAITFPQLKLEVMVKKSDYAIPELGVEVKSRGFKVCAVRALGAAEVVAQPAGKVVLAMAMTEVMDRLFAARNQRDFPTDSLQRKIAARLHKSVGAEEWLRRREQAEGGRQMVYLAPLSAVANEAWIFWETGQVILQVSSDYDLDGGDVAWMEHHLRVHAFDLREQVVLSREETPGSNAYLSRNRAGRILYNCVILGRREYHDRPAEVRNTD
ncbi:MAG: hypothetical protein RBS57_09240 [Desulforhabdus sp.]|jgi:hypothetical protein|nr:hypothetical protein [Desulforhabdus sp.]